MVNSGSWSTGRLAATAAFALGMAIVQSDATADRITYDGQTWNDVLIYQSSTMYYVKVPDEGIIFNVPIDAVSPSNVEIVRDPYYRDELKERFEQNATASPRTTTGGVGKSVFNVADVGGGNAAETAQPNLEPIDSAAGGTAADPPTGPDPMEALKGVLKSMNFKLADRDGDLVATSADGATEIVFLGGNLEGGLEYTATVPEAAAPSQMVALNMLGNLAAQAAPWAPAFLQQEVAPLLQSGGTAEKTEGPLSISAEVTKTGGNLTVQISATPAAA